VVVGTVVVEVVAVLLVVVEVEVVEVDVEVVGTPAQVPPPQVSLMVEGSLSSHGSVLSVCMQPSWASQLSSVQGLPSSHVSGDPLTQLLFMPQVSRPSQMLPLSHCPSFVQQPEMGMWTQPLAGSQESVVQTALSSQLIGVLTQPLAGSQESLVQALESSQLRGVPDWH